MVEYINTLSALMALASNVEKVELQKQLEAPEIDDGYTVRKPDPELQPLLLERLMEKLRSGEWLASGFGYESGQPTNLHPRLWQRMFISVDGNSAHDSHVRLRGRSVTGSFHSLAFRPARTGREQPRRDARGEAIRDLQAYFERLDSELPESASKKHFFQKGRDKFGSRAVDGWMRQAWRDAKLKPIRRLSGTKKSN
jgi:hypothetical protein